MTSNSNTEENLAEINPNLPLVKRDLINTGMRYGFSVGRFDAVRLPDGVIKLEVELSRV